MTNLEDWGFIIVLPASPCIPHKSECRNASRTLCHRKPHNLLPIVARKRCWSAVWDCYYCCCQLSLLYHSVSPNWWTVDWTHQNYGSCWMTTGLEGHPTSNWETPSLVWWPQNANCRNCSRKTHRPAVDWLAWLAGGNLSREKQYWLMRFPRNCLNCVNQ
jgi:hypothetical protein